ncbi:MAG: rod shape-determining protein MreD [Actinobacteria bacterium]|nr:rod shape-determining protein MreD [Actinomycetota bacterium]
MTPRRFLFGAVTVVAAVLLQSAVLTRLPLPGGAPDLLLVLVVAFALAEGPLSGTVTGFVTGLLADLGTDHELGRSALVYTLVGYAAGLVHDAPALGGGVSGGRARSPLQPLVVVAVAAAAGVTVYAAVGFLLGDDRITLDAYTQSLVATVAYCVLLTPFVVPVIGILVRRLDFDPLRR